MHLRVEHKPAALGVPRDVGLELRREQVVAGGRRAAVERPLRHLVGPVALRLQVASHVSHRPIAAEQAAASLVSRERALAQLLHQLVHVVGARQPSLCHSRRLLACSPRHTHRVVLPHPPGREVGQRKDAVACPLGRPRLQLACQGERTLRAKPRTLGRRHRSRSKAVREAKVGRVARPPGKEGGHFQRTTRTHT